MEVEIYRLDSLLNVMNKYLGNTELWLDNSINLSKLYLDLAKKTQDYVEFRKEVMSKYTQEEQQLKKEEIFEELKWKLNEKVTLEFSKINLFNKGKLPLELVISLSAIFKVEKYSYSKKWE